MRISQNAFVNLDVLENSLAIGNLDDVHHKIGVVGYNSSERLILRQ